MLPDVARIPCVDARGRDLFRLHLLTDPATGRTREPFHFAARPTHGGGRFDLLAPRGTCYVSDSRVGAWVETFRGARLINVVDVRRRGVTRTRCPRAAMVADLTAPEAVAAGVTLDLHAGQDRPRTWAIADAIDARAGVRGIVTWTRHDPSAGSRTFALFDGEGEHAPFGWAWRSVTSSALDDPVLLDELAARGLGVADVPHDLPTVRPSPGH